MLLALVSTLILEGGLAYVLVRKSARTEVVKSIILINLITVPCLHLMLPVTEHLIGGFSMLLLPFYEIVIVLVETLFLCSRHGSKIPMGRIFGLVLLLNVISCISVELAIIGIAANWLAQ